MQSGHVWMACAMGMAVASAASAVTVAHWRFEGTTGTAATTVSDSAGANTGTGQPVATEPLYSATTASATVPQTGAANTSSLDFERGSLQYVTIPDSNALDFANNSSFTLEAWVKLETVAAAGTANVAQRQYVLLKKGSTGIADSGLNYALLANVADLTSNFGKTGTLTRREIAFQVGDGTAFSTVASNFEITDTDWHFIAAAFDSAANTVRFTLDNQTETATGVTRNPAVNAGELLIGTHFNSAAVQDAAFDGLIDEVRISSGVVPLNELLNVPEPTGIATLGIMAAVALCRRRARI